MSDIKFEGDLKKHTDHLARTCGATAAEPLLNKIKERLASGDISFAKARATVNRRLTRLENQIEKLVEAKRGLQYSLRQIDDWEKKALLRTKINQGVPIEVAQLHAQILKLKVEAQREDITVAQQRKLWEKTQELIDRLQSDCQHQFVASYDSYYVGRDLGQHACDAHVCLICGAHAIYGLNNRSEDSLIFPMKNKADSDKMVHCPDFPLKNIIEYLIKRSC